MKKIASKKKKIRLTKLLLIKEKRNITLKKVMMFYYNK